MKPRGWLRPELGFPAKAGSNGDNRCVPVNPGPGKRGRVSWASLASEHWPTQQAPGSVIDSASKKVTGGSQKRRPVAASGPFGAMVCQPPPAKAHGFGRSKIKLLIFLKLNKFNTFPVKISPKAFLKIKKQSKTKTNLYNFSRKGRNLSITNSYLKNKERELIRTCLNVLGSAIIKRDNLKSKYISGDEKGSECPCVWLVLSRYPEDKATSYRRWQTAYFGDTGEIVAQ